MLSILFATQLYLLRSHCSSNHTHKYRFITCSDLAEGLTKYLQASDSFNLALCNKYCCEVWRKSFVKCYGDWNKVIAFLKQPTDEFRQKIFKMSLFSVSWNHQNDSENSIKSLFSSRALILIKHPKFQIVRGFDASTNVFYFALVPGNFVNLLFAINGHNGHQTVYRSEYENGAIHRLDTVIFPISERIHWYSSKRSHAANQSQTNVRK